VAVDHPDEGCPVGRPKAPLEHCPPRGRVAPLALHGQRHARVQMALGQWFNHDLGPDAVRGWFVRSEECSHPHKPSRMVAGSQPVRAGHALVGDTACR